MLINVKMPTIVDILTFMSTIDFLLSWFEHEKEFYNLKARPPDKFQFFFLNSQPRTCLVGTQRTISVRGYCEAPKTYASSDDKLDSLKKYILTIYYSIFSDLDQ